MVEKGRQSHTTVGGCQLVLARRLPGSRPGCRFVLARLRTRASPVAGSCLPCCRLVPSRLPPRLNSTISAQPISTPCNIIISETLQLYYQRALLGYFPVVAALEVSKGAKNGPFE